MIVIRPGNKIGSLYTKQEGYCIQSWVEKRLLTASTFRVFTWKKENIHLGKWKDIEGAHLKSKPFGGLFSCRNALCAGALTPPTLEIKIW